MVFGATNPQQIELMEFGFNGGRSSLGIVRTRTSDPGGKQTAMLHGWSLDMANRHRYVTTETHSVQLVIR